MAMRQRREHLASAQVETKYIDGSDAGTVQFPIQGERSRPSLPIQVVALETRHDPKLSTCVLCGGHKDKLLISQEYWGEKLIVVTEELAAYRCDACGDETVDERATAEFIRLTLDAFAEKHDCSIATALKQSLVAFTTQKMDALGGASR